MQKLSVAILAALPLMLRADDVSDPDQIIWENISEKPTMSYDPRTASPCTEWYNNDGTVDCETVVSQTMTDMVSFLEWNPSIIGICQNFKKGQSYCLDASSAVPSSTKPPPSPSTTTPASTSTQPSNGISTPSPTQPGMVNNCDKFYAVRYDDTCAKVSSLFDVSLANFVKWNSIASKDCNNLTVNNFVCVSAAGQAVSTTSTSTTSTSTTPPTTTSAGNGIQTPQPTQPGMVKNCNKFHFIFPGNSCDQITSYEHISQQDFAKWNPQIGLQCTGLQVNAVACVGVLPDATPTSTTPSNGIETPQPTQPGMVGNCNSFHHIFPGNTCDQITSYHHISQQDFAKWNPQVGEKCTGLVADANACVGVLGPTSTAPSNGIETPQPTQPGMVGNCNSFHHIFPGNTCDQITSYHHISQQDFAKWNPQVGEKCTGLLADANACVGVY